MSGAHAYQLHTGDLPETLRQLNLTLMQLDRRITALESNWTGRTDLKSLAPTSISTESLDTSTLTAETGNIGTLTAESGDITTLTADSLDCTDLTATTLAAEEATIADLRAVAGDAVNLTDEWEFPTSVWNGDLTLTGRHQAGQIASRELSAPDAWLGHLQGDTATLLRASLEGMLVNAAGLTGEWEFPSWRLAGDLLAGRISAAQLEAAALVSDDAWLLAVAGDTSTWNRLQVIGATLDMAGLTGEVEYPSWVIQADLIAPSCSAGRIESLDLTTAEAWIGNLSCVALTGTQAVLEGVTLSSAGLTGEREFPSWVIQADLATSGQLSVGGPLAVAGGADIATGLGVGGFQVDGTGNVRLRGAATSWDDLRIEPTVRGAGVRNPSFEQYLTDGAGSIGVFLYSFDDAVVASEKEIYFTMQHPHSWAGTSIYIHVHWIGNVDDTSASPRWGLEYSWANVGEVFGNTTIIYTDGINYTLTGSDPNVTAGKHYINAFSALTPTDAQDDLSSILIGRLFRNSSSVNDTYNAATNKCGLLYIDAHIEKDGFGSNSEYVK